MFPLDDRGQVIHTNVKEVHIAGEPLVHNDYVKLDPTDSTNKTVIKALGLSDSIGYFYNNIVLDANVGCKVVIVYWSNGQVYGSSTSIGSCCNLQLQGPSSMLCFEDSVSFGPEQLLLQSENYTTNNFFLAHTSDQSKFFQTFSLAQDFKLTKIELSLNKSGVPTGNFDMELRNATAADAQGTVIENSTVASYGAVGTGFGNIETFTYPTEPLLVTAMGANKFGFGLNNHAGVFIDSPNHVQMWRSTSNNVASGTYSNSSDNGATWFIQPQDTRFNIYGKLGGGASSKKLVIQNDIWVQVAGLPNTSNNILAQEVILPNPNDVAYVILNETTTPTNLIIFVDDIANIDPLNPLLFIIARRVEDKLSVGLNSNLILDVGECGYLDEVPQAQGFQVDVLTFDNTNIGMPQTINTNFNTIMNVMIRDEQNECEVELTNCLDTQDVKVCSNVEGTFTITTEGYT